jgi:hypothetical protein
VARTAHSPSSSGGTSHSPLPLCRTLWGRSSRAFALSVAEGDEGTVEQCRGCGHVTSSGSSSFITHRLNTLQLLLTHALQSPSTRRPWSWCPLIVCWFCDLSVTSVPPSR